MSNGYLAAAAADIGVASEIGDGFGLEVIEAGHVGDPATLTGAANVGLIISLASAQDETFVALLHALVQTVSRAQLILVEPEARAAFAFLPEAWPAMSLEEARTRAQALTLARTAEQPTPEPEEKPAEIVADAPPAPESAPEEPPPAVEEEPTAEASAPEPERVQAEEQAETIVEPAPPLEEPPQALDELPAETDGDAKLVGNAPAPEIEHEQSASAPPPAATEPPPALDGATADVESRDHAPAPEVEQAQAETTAEPAPVIEETPQAPDDAPSATEAVDEEIRVENVVDEEPLAVDAPAPIEDASPVPEPPAEQVEHIETQHQEPVSETQDPPEAAPPQAAAPAPAPAPARKREGGALGGVIGEAPVGAVTGSLSRAPPVSAPADATAFAPKKLRRGTPELVRIVMHQPKDLQAVIKAARKLDPRTDAAPQGMSLGDVALGARVGIALDVRGATCDGSVQRRTWTGAPIDFSFSVEAEESARQAVFLARVFIDDAQIGVLAFARQISGPAKKPASTGDRVRLKRHKRVFLSYSSTDRETVSAIATAYQMAGVQHFWDRASLKSGEQWHPRLRREIDRADLFHLCWSKAAAESQWVTKEAEHALTTRRRSGGKKPEITVQMLDGPPWAKHPDSLDSINFDDFVRAAIVGYARGEE